jgi:hypothetical protein
MLMLRAHGQFARQQRCFQLSTLSPGTIKIFENFADSVVKEVTEWRR